MASFPGGYPAARRLDLVEELHGYRVADPYRWLEDADSAETQDWLAAQESLWDQYREGLPRREEFAARVAELLRVGAVGLPTWRGTTRFSMRRDPDQEHAVLYVSDHEISGMSGAPAPDIPDPSSPSEAGLPSFSGHPVNAVKKSIQNGSR